MAVERNREGSARVEPEGIEAPMVEPAEGLSLEEGYRRSLEQSGALRGPGLPAGPGLPTPERGHSSVPPRVPTDDSALDHAERLPAKPLSIQPERPGPPRWLSNLLFFGGLALLSFIVGLKLRPPFDNSTAAVRDVPLQGRSVDGFKGSVVAIFTDYNCPACRLQQRQAGQGLRRSASLGHLRLAVVQLPQVGEPSRSAARAMACVGKIYPQLFWPLHHQMMTLPDSLVVDRERVVSALMLPARPSVERCIDDAGSSGGAAMVAADQAFTSKLGQITAPFVSVDGVPYVEPLMTLSR